MVGAKNKVEIFLLYLLVVLTVALIAFTGYTVAQSTTDGSTGSEPALPIADAISCPEDSHPGITASDVSSQFVSPCTISGEAASSEPPKGQVDNPTPGQTADQALAADLQERVDNINQFYANIRNIPPRLQQERDRKLRELNAQLDAVRDACNKAGSKALSQLDKFCTDSAPLGCLPNPRVINKYQFSCGETQEAKVEGDLSALKKALRAQGMSQKQIKDHPDVQSLENTKKDIQKKIQDKEIDPSARNIECFATTKEFRCNGTSRQ